MPVLGFEGKWAYRFPIGEENGTVFQIRKNEITKSSDLLINVSGSLKPSLPRSASHTLIATFFTQIKIAQGPEKPRNCVNAHDVFFTFVSVCRIFTCP